MANSKKLKPKVTTAPAPTVAQIVYAANIFRARSLFELLRVEEANTTSVNELGRLPGSVFIEHLFGTAIHGVNSLACDASNYEYSPFDDESTLLARNIILEAKNKLHIQKNNVLQEGSLLQLKFATACVERIDAGVVTLNIVLTPEFVAGMLAGVSTLTLPTADLCLMGYAKPRLMDCLSLIRKSVHNQFYLLEDNT